MEIIKSKDQDDVYILTVFDMEFISIFEQKSALIKPYYNCYIEVKAIKEIKIRFVINNLDKNEIFEKLLENKEKLINAIFNNKLKMRKIDGI